MRRQRRKRLGQHFLKNPHVLKRIIQRISPDKDELIIEIGAGRGELTFPLAQKAGKVIAIEKDPSLITFLKRKKISNVTIIGKDVLKIDFDEMIKKGKKFKEVKIVGNLPYSISTPLLFKLLKAEKNFSECLFLLQKEVAERICSQPGSKAYSPLTILFQVHFLTRFHFIVSPRCFCPPPKVYSALISLRKRELPLFQVEKEELFQKFLKEAFKHRRKILLNNLLKINLPLPLINSAYQELDLERNVRPEQLTIAQYVSLYNLFIKSLY